MAGQSITITDLLTRLRYAADIEGQATRHPDARLTEIVTDGINAYRARVCEVAQSNPFTLESTGTTVAGTADYALASNLTSLRHVELSVGGQWVELHELQDAEAEYRSDQQGVPAFFEVANPIPFEATVQQPSLRLYPTPSGAYSYRYRYEPYDTAGSGTFFPLLEGGIEWVIYWSAVRVMARDDDDEQGSKMASLFGQADERVRKNSLRYLRTGPTRRIDTRGRRQVATRGIRHRLVT